MATIIAADIVGFKPGVMIHKPVSDIERRLIEARRRMAEEGIVRVDRRPVTHGPWPANKQESQP